MIVRQSPPDSALRRSVDPDWRWQTTEQLLHSIEHSLRILVWQPTKDGHTGRNQPKPIPAPWVEDSPEQGETTTYGGTAVELDEMDAWLASRGVMVRGC